MIVINTEVINLNVFENRNKIYIYTIINCFDKSFLYFFVVILRFIALKMYLYSIPT